MPDPMLKLPVAGLLCGALLSPGAAARAETALDCLPPLPPAPVNDAATRATYAAEIREGYIAYFDAAQTYLHCLESARAEVTDEVRRAIADFQALGPAPDD
ncbi:hypothetical protein [Cypionkella sp.]|uniref:hypothetical protein n=1 Tax=Cypionkella sp. TaxID=2811411 RepID=UPI00271E9E98|nr:hypothetical protein [Cypionkella sp.]MDO8986375.1 hypothetical protein [Cypionkella sp.]MDP2050020.1 hypothetical protein [Cypionkella sp.]